MAAKRAGPGPGRGNVMRAASTVSAQRLTKQSKRSCNCHAGLADLRLKASSALSTVRRSESAVLAPLLLGRASCLAVGPPGLTLICVEPSPMTIAGDVDEPWATLSCGLVLQEGPWT
ncbi:hypothetical protein PoB_002792800 [Plakobranchus ocellatus]|uniref:Uncharacterized protein n=1 Tax=Plakobranchus ocellatus TaxID=259542 RepID=A0AAV4A446_9GAST|nr:hypothetical protein PoB_002792800 [Plakobranchus ocellatus]